MLDFDESMAADLAYAALIDEATAAYLARAHEVARLKGGHAVRAAALNEARAERDAAYGAAWRRYVNADPASFRPDPPVLPGHPCRAHGSYSGAAECDRANG